MDISRRNLLIGAAAVVLVAGVGYVAWNGFGTASSPGGSGELLAPGPLPDMALGAPNAPVTIVEYASLTCSHCKNFELKTFPELKKRYIDTGKVRFIFREFVLNDVDLLAIVLARCVNKEQYFPFIETLFEKQEQWAVNNPVPPLLAIAKQAGFTDESFKQCASNQKAVEAVKSQAERAANQFGVNSTPTFFINGTRRAGDMSIEEMETLIQPYLQAG